MPLPTPGKAEKRADFISRCVSAVADEFDDNDQRVAVCGAQWGKAHPGSKKPKAVKASFVGEQIVGVPWDLALALPVAAPHTTATETGPDGVPRKLYRKELIRDGSYVDGDGMRFKCTPALRAHFQKQFQLMLANGVKVPIFADHDDDPSLQGAGPKADSERARGWVRDLQLEGESLYIVGELLGDNADTLAASNDVSLYSPAAWRDGRGNEYARPIRHVSLTPVPVIPGLKGFELIAASFRGDEQTGEKTMDWTKFADLVDLEDGQEVTDDNGEELILGALGRRKEQIEQLQAAIAGLKKKIAELKASGDTAGDAATEPDPLVMSLAHDNRRLKLDQLVSGGKLDANAAKGIFDMFTGDALKLSLTKGVPDNFDRLLGVLAKNKPVRVGEASGPQVLRLADAAKDNPDILVKDAEARAARARGA